MVTRAIPIIDLRELCPADGALLPAFFDALSERSLYRRFSSPLRHLGQDWIEHLTTLDPATGACVVAVETRGRHDAPRLVGLAEIYGSVGASSAEGGLLVADGWQGRGLGSALIDRLVKLACARSIDAIWGLVQPDNSAMLGLARKHGYPIVWGDLGYEVRVAVGR